MKLVSLLAVCGLAAASTPAVQWEQFKKTHSKTYKSHSEELKRFEQFKISLDYIEEHNARFLAGKETYHVAINKFADLNNEEFARTYLPSTEESRFRLNYQCPTQFTSQSASYDDYVDWSTTQNSKNTVMVTQVKDQGQCGSCWSFATTGTFEGQECMCGNQDCATWTGASEQNLVDCSTTEDDDLGPYYDMGCNGGWIDNGLYYIQVNGGIDHEDDYPYTSGGGSSPLGKCAYDSASNVGRVADCGFTTPGDENELMMAIHDIGPIGIAIDASGIGFQLYSGGVYSNSNCSQSRLNHAVLAVGYGNNNGQDYWVVKNSWGEGWGLHGFIDIARNSNNMCGVATTPAYPIVTC